MKASINLIKTQLESKLKGKIKSFYVGDPIYIPESAMPCISISPNNTQTEMMDNQRDGRIHTIDVALIVDARKYFGKMPNEMVGTSYLLETMAEEDADGTINDSTILGVIRSNLSLGTNRIITNVTSIDYSTRRRTEDLVTLEAILTLEVTQISNR